MSGERGNRDRMHQGDVLGVFDRNGNLVIDVDKVIIRAEDVIIIKSDDDRRHGRSDREDVAGVTDRNDRKDYRRF